MSACGVRGRTGDEYDCTYLNVTDWILTGNGDGILGAHHRDLAQEGIANGSFDLLDLFHGLVVVQAIQEQVDVGRGAELLVVVLAKLALGGVELLGDRQEAVDDGGARGHDIVPVHVHHGGFRKDIEVLLELGQAPDGGRGAVGTPLVIGEGHDVPGLLQLRLGSQVSGASRDVLSVFIEMRQQVEVRVVEDGVLAILSVDSPELVLISPIGFQDVGHGLVGMVRDVFGQLLVRDGKLGEVRHSHVSVHGSRRCWRRCC